MKYETKTKFSLGRYTNGTYTVLGLMLKGTLYGFIIKTDYPLIYKVFSFVCLSEFYNSTDTHKEFKKYRNVFSITQPFFKFSDVEEIIFFLKETCTLKFYMLRYIHLIKDGNRMVLIEKYSSKIILQNYMKLTSAEEFILIQIIYKKHFCRKIFNDIYISDKPRECKGDIY